MYMQPSLQSAAQKPTPKYAFFHTHLCLSSPFNRRSLLFIYLILVQINRRQSVWGAVAEPPPTDNLRYHRTHSPLLSSLHNPTSSSPHLSPSLSFSSCCTIFSIVLFINFFNYSSVDSPHHLLPLLAALPMQERASLLCSPAHGAHPGAKGRCTVRITAPDTPT
jgi:hypothetical protein